MISFYDADDLPDWVSWAGRLPLLSPGSADTDDRRFSTAQGFACGADFQRYPTAVFDRRYAEGDEAPKLTSVGLRCLITGGAGRAASRRSPAPSTTCNAAATYGSAGARASPDTGTRSTHRSAPDRPSPLAARLVSVAAACARLGRREVFAGRARAPLVERDDEQFIRSASRRTSRPVEVVSGLRGRE